MSKSEWTRMACTTDRDKSAIKSWFSPLCDDMEPESCEVLCDIETDRAKKVRATMIRKNGNKILATYTMGARTYSIRIKPLKTAHADEPKRSE